MKSIDKRLELGKNSRIILDGRETNFYLTEWVSQKDWRQHKNHCLLFLRSDTIALAQFMRKWFDAPMIINNWYDGGPLHQRGYRASWTTIGSKNSMHRFSGGFDWSSTRIKADEIRRKQMDNQAEFMAAGLTRIENGAYAPTWSHNDMKFTGMGSIKVVAPLRKKKVRHERSQTRMT